MEVANGRLIPSSISHTTYQHLCSVIADVSKFVEGEKYIRRNPEGFLGDYGYNQADQVNPKALNKQDKNADEVINLEDSDGQHEKDEDDAEDEEKGNLPALRTIHHADPADVISYVEELQQALRRDPDGSFPIRRLLGGPWAVFPKYLLPLMKHFRDSDQVAFQITKVMVMLTMPLADDDEAALELIDPSMTFDTQLVRDKEEITHYRECLELLSEMLLQAVEIVLDDEDEVEARFTRKQAEIRMELVLTFLRNILLPVRFAPGSSGFEKDQHGHMKLVCLLAELKILDLLVATFSERENLIIIPHSCSFLAVEILALSFRHSSSRSVASEFLMSNKVYHDGPSDVLAVAAANPITANPGARLSATSGRAVSGYTGARPLNTANNVAVRREIDERENIQFKLLLKQEQEKASFRSRPRRGESRFGGMFEAKDAIAKRLCTSEDLRKQAAMSKSGISMHFGMNLDTRVQNYKAKRVKAKAPIAEMQTTRIVDGRTLDRNLCSKFFLTLSDLAENVMKNCFDPVTRSMYQHIRESGEHRLTMEKRRYYEFIAAIVGVQSFKCLDLSKDGTADNIATENISEKDEILDARHLDCQRLSFAFESRFFQMLSTDLMDFTELFKRSEFREMSCCTRTLTVIMRALMILKDSKPKEMVTEPVASHDEAPHDEANPSLELRATDNIAQTAFHILGQFFYSEGILDTVMLLLREYEPSMAASEHLDNVIQLVYITFAWLKEQDELSVEPSKQRRRRRRKRRSEEQLGADFLEGGDENEDLEDEETYISTAHEIIRYAHSRILFNLSIVIRAALAVNAFAQSSASLLGVRGKLIAKTFYILRAIWDVCHGKEFFENGVHIMFFHITQLTMYLNIMQMADKHQEQAKVQTLRAAQAGRRGAYLGSKDSTLMQLRRFAYQVSSEFFDIVDTFPQLGVESLFHLRKQDCRAYMTSYLSRQNEMRNQLVTELETRLREEAARKAAMEATAGMAVAVGSTGLDAVGTSGVNVAHERSPSELFDLFAAGTPAAMMQVSTTDLDLLANLTAINDRLDQQGAPFHTPANQANADDEEGDSENDLVLVSHDLNLPSKKPSTKRKLDFDSDSDDNLDFDLSDKEKDSEVEINSEREDKQTTKSSARRTLEHSDQAEDLKRESATSNGGAESTKPFSKRRRRKLLMLSDSESDSENVQVDFD